MAFRLMSRPISITREPRTNSTAGRSRSTARKSSIDRSGVERSASRIRRAAARSATPARRPARTASPLPRPRRVSECRHRPQVTPRACARGSPPSRRRSHRQPAPDARPERHRRNAGTPRRRGAPPRVARHDQGQFRGRHGAHAAPPGAEALPQPALDVEHQKTSGLGRRTPTRSDRRGRRRGRRVWSIEATTTGACRASASPGAVQ